MCSGGIQCWDRSNRQSLLAYAQAPWPLLILPSSCVHKLTSAWCGMVQETKLWQVYGVVWWCKETQDGTVFVFIWRFNSRCLRQTVIWGRPPSIDWLNYKTIVETTIKMPEKVFSSTPSWASIHHHASSHAAASRILIITILYDCFTGAQKRNHQV